MLRIGDRIKVKDDTPWHPTNHKEGSPLSSRAGRHGKVVAIPSRSGYDYGVVLDGENGGSQEWNIGFNEDELELEGES